MTDVTTIVDVGARYGIHPSWRAFDGDMLYIMSEADAAESTRLADKYKDRKDIKILPYALAEAKGTRTFYTTRHKAFSSFCPPNLDSLFLGRVRKDQCAIVETIDVPCDSMDNALKNQGLNADFLKINTEGSELDVLKGARQQIEQHILGVYMEVYFSSVFTESCLFDDIMKFFREYDFRLLNLSYAGKGVSLNALVDGGRYGVLESSDCVWVKNWSTVIAHALSCEDGVSNLLKYSAFCFLNNAPDLGLHVLIQYVDSFKKHNGFGPSRLARFVDICVQKHFNALSKAPAFATFSLADLYAKLFCRDMKVAHHYFESSEINPG